MLLVVDDDPAFLEKAQELLDHGRGIFMALDGKHARELLDVLGASVTVAIVDLDLPGEDGFTLIRDMRRRFPHLAIVATSGVVKDDVLESARIVGARVALHKPITPEWNAALAAIRDSARRA
jgi:CheY-like chemotaxis protein